MYREHILPAEARKEHKRALNPLELKLHIANESAFGCWELNPGSVEEQPVLLTTKPSLQPLSFLIACFCILLQVSPLVPNEIQNM